MVSTERPEIKVSGSKMYWIQGFHLAEKLRLRDLRDKLSVPACEFSNYEMVLRYGEDSFCFIYNYGSVVFFNVPDDLQKIEINKIQAIAGKTEGDPSLTSDRFQLELREPSDPNDVTNNKVYFDRILVSKLLYEKVKIVCMLIAESTGLDYYELLVENLMDKTNSFSKKLQTQGKVLQESEELIKFVGLCLNTKQEIISNLYIVDSPDETWESPELDRLHQELKGMLEIDVRYRALDTKIKIIQDSLEIMVDLTKSKRETALEVTIILLIAIELMVSVIRMH